MVEPDQYWFEIQHFLISIEESTQNLFIKNIFIRNDSQIIPLELHNFIQNDSQIILLELHNFIQNNSQIIPLELHIFLTHKIIFL